MNWEDYTKTLWAHDLALFDNRIKILAGMAIIGHTGFSFKEIRYLKWGDVVSQHELVIGHKRAVISGVLTNYLLELFAKSPHGLNDYVMANRDGRPVTITYFNRMATAYCRESVTSHTLRKLYGLQFMKLNGYTIDAAKALQRHYGHQQIGRTLAYLGIEIGQELKQP